ncbi:hypothetical protein DVH05_020132 [Phytophthora capsici]|nr:hypothetical protein DVH05_020132 [Phytophthora capsici]
MTADDRQQLCHYRESYQRVPENSLPKLSAENGVSLFKLVLVDQQAADFKTKYSVEYASNSVSYEEVIAITYAWHESDNKTSIELDRKTIQLGDEWDVDAVLDTLVDLSNDNWIWMDQFSLNQDDVATATLSYTIPMIFRNVRVVAFLPYTVCDRLFTQIKLFREEKNPDASFAISQVMLHDLACECTDGIYGWLSRLWPWQELMLASSLRFVWGLGESKWTRREFLNEPEKHKDEKQPPGKDCSISRAWARVKQEGRKIKKSVNRSITDLSTFEQPIMKLLKELTKRNTESVIIPKEESASLSMVNYFCMRLLCGAEVYMPSPSKIEPIKCLKVLQEIASTGRKGGRLYDCYYAAAAFINDSNFLPEKKKSMATQKHQDERGNVVDELELRLAYIRLYEREHARLRLPEKEVLQDPYLLFQEYTKLYVKRNDKKIFFRGPYSLLPSDGWLQQDYIELYHNVHNTTLVEYAGIPLVNTSEPQVNEIVTPIVWITHERLDIQDAPPTLSMEKQLEERMKVASLVFENSRGGFLNAFVLAGMNEEAFCETRVQDGHFCGDAYDIKSIERINVGRKCDFWANSIRKIAKNLHPSQVSRIKNFNTILTDVRVGFSPLAHAIIHATCYKADPFPAHLAKTCLALLGRRDTRSYVNVITVLLGESFDLLMSPDRNHKNTFELAKITFSDGTTCIGIISSLLKKIAFNITEESAIEKFVLDVVLAPFAPFLDSIIQAGVKVVKTHRRLLLCFWSEDNWSVVGYIPGFDAEMNAAALGSISHTNVSITRISVENAEVPRFLVH